MVGRWLFRQPCNLTSCHTVFSCTSSCVCFSGSSLPLLWVVIFPEPPSLGYLNTHLHPLSILRLLLLLHTLNPQLHASSCKCPQLHPCCRAAAWCKPSPCHASLISWTWHSPTWPLQSSTAVKSSYPHIFIRLDATPGSHKKKLGHVYYDQIVSQQEKLLPTWVMTLFEKIIYFCFMWIVVLPEFMSL